MTLDMHDQPRPQRTLAPARPALAAPKVPILSRREFLDMFGEQYESGQHASFFGPTQRGKTTLCHQMLAQVISPKLKALVLAGKPPSRDPVMARAAERLNLRIVEEWPPPYSFKDRKNNGWVLRPQHDMRNHKSTKAHIANHFGAAMRDAYATPPDKKMIIVGDETHLIQNTYGLKDEIEAPLMRGAPVVAYWSLVQRNRNITYFVYNSPEWLLIYNDPDRSNQERYSDIGGVDPRILSALQPTLKMKRGDDGKAPISQTICIQRSGPNIFIVDTE